MALWTACLLVFWLLVPVFTWLVVTIRADNREQAAWRAEAEARGVAQFRRNRTIHIAQMEHDLGMAWHDQDWRHRRSCEECLRQIKTDWWLEDSP